MTYKNISPFIKRLIHLHYFRKVKQTIYIKFACVMWLRCRQEKGKIDADGGMSCYMYFTFFSIVFQSYQDDGKVIRKGVSNGTL